MWATSPTQQSSWWRAGRRSAILPGRSCRRAPGRRARANWRRRVWRAADFGRRALLDVRAASSTRRRRFGFGADLVGQSGAVDRHEKNRRIAAAPGRTFPARHCRCRISHFRLSISPLRVTLIGLGAVGLLAVCWLTLHYGLSKIAGAFAAIGWGLALMVAVRVLVISGAGVA